MRANPPVGAWIAIAMGALALAALAYAKRDVLAKFVTGTMRVPGHPQPLRVASVPAAKGMVA